MSAWTDWLEHHMLSCPSKQLFGVECPGCGFQRSFVALMKGELFHSLQLYPALIPFLLTWILLVLHLVFRFKNGAKWITYSFAGTAAIVLVSFVIKTVIKFQTHH